MSAAPMPSFEPFHFDGTNGFLHHPQNDAGFSLVLTHGAGSNCQSPLLVAVAQAVQSAGFHVLRCDLAFRQARKSGPPHPSQAAADREGLRSAVEALRRVSAGRVCLGGHSYGGRQASMLAAEHPELAERLLLLSYPLHPPRKPEQLRTAHFAAVRTPALFVHGDNDPFGTPAEMETALSALGAPHRLSIVNGAGHDLNRGKFDLAAQIVSPFLSLAAI